MTALAVANVEQTARDTYGLCETANDLLQRRINENLGVARRILAQRGGIASGGGSVQWQAVNQFTQGTAEVTLPRMLIGGAPATQSRSFQTPSPVVDEISRLTGSTVTIFQRMNEQGDMLRVATTVAAADGNRAIGTYIPAIGPDGAPTPVIASVLRGEVYRGTAFVVNDWYVAAYEAAARRSRPDHRNAICRGAYLFRGVRPAHHHEHGDWPHRTHCGGGMQGQPARALHHFR